MIIYKMSSINLISKTIKYVGLGKDDPSYNFDISGELRTDLLYLKNKIGIKNITPKFSIDMSGCNDAILLPVGASNERPLNPVDGLIRYNKSDKIFEGYSDGKWASIGTGGSGSGGGGSGGGSGGSSGGGGEISIRGSISDIKDISDDTFGDNMNIDRKEGEILYDTSKNMFYESSQSKSDIVSTTLDNKVNFRPLGYSFFRENLEGQPPEPFFFFLK